MEHSKMKVRTRRVVIAVAAVVLIPLCWAIGQPGRPRAQIAGRFVHLKLHWPYDFSIGQEEDSIYVGGLCISYPTSFRRAVAGIKHGWIPEVEIKRGENLWCERFSCEAWTCHGEMLISLNKSSWDRELERRKSCREKGIEP